MIADTEHNRLIHIELFADAMNQFALLWILELTHVAANFIGTDIIGRFFNWFYGLNRRFRFRFLDTFD